MTGGTNLERRSRVLEALAQRFLDAAERTSGSRASVLREESRALRAEALRLALAAAGASRQ